MVWPHRNANCTDRDKRPDRKIRNAGAQGCVALLGRQRVGNVRDFGLSGAAQALAFGHAGKGGASGTAIIHWHFSVVACYSASRETINVQQPTASVERLSIAFPEKTANSNRNFRQ